MKQLKEEGYEIEAIQNKGYCLKDVPDVLGESEIKSRLHTRWAGQTLYYYDEIDSTNTQIKRLAEEDAPHGTLAVADYQSRGKGRRGRAGILLTEVLFICQSCFARRSGRIGLRC